MVRGGRGSSTSLPRGSMPCPVFAMVGRPTPASGERPNAEYSVVSGDYFAAMGIRLLGGRSFDTRDRSDTPAVVVVNREFVRRHFPGTSPVGHRILAGFDFSGG